MPLAPPPNKGDSSSRVVADAFEKYMNLLLTSTGGTRVWVTSWLHRLAVGRVEALYLQGRAWRTRRNLTMSSIVISVPEGLRVSFEEWLAGNLVLTVPARGDAEVVFDGEDISNCLRCERVASQLPRLAAGQVTVDPDTVKVDARLGELSLAVSVGGHAFLATLGADAAGQPVARMRQRDAAWGAAEVRALELALAGFFRNLWLDLGGIELRFAAMAFAPGEGAGGDALRMRLRMTVARIPNPMLDEF